MKVSLKNKELEMLKSIFEVNQNDLLAGLKLYLKQNYNQVYSTNSYIYAVGESPVALVAHLDTVFPKPPKDIYYDKECAVMWSPNGLGADDRAGVFSIITLINRGWKPSIIFTTDEEIGGVGATKFQIDFPKPISQINYLIELDRQGAVDCVFYDCDNNLFEKYIEDYGFKTALGSYSDICTICPTWGIAGVNLSIGYENEHTCSEILNLVHMLNTIEKVESMILESATLEKAFEYIPAENTYNKIFSTLKYSSNTFDEFCWGCGTPFKKEDMLQISTKRDYGIESNYYCIDCLAEYCNYCTECGQIYDVAEEGGTCPICGHIDYYKGQYEYEYEDWKKVGFDWKS